MKEDAPKPISITELNRIINWLLKQDLKKVEYGQIKKKVIDLFNAGFMVVNIPKGRTIYRCRAITPEQVIKNKHEISYPPITKIEKYNRASSNVHQIFYGAIGTKEIDRGEIIALTETNNILNSHDFKSPYELIVTSQWITKKELTVVATGFHKNYVEKNFQLRELAKNMDEISQQLQDRRKQLKIISEFFGQEFVKDVSGGKDYEYKVTSAYGDIIFDSGIAGVLYPSKKSEGKGFNIALSKEITDKFLELKVGIILKIEVFGERVLVSNYLESSTINDGNFSWKEPSLKESASNYEKHLYKLNQLK